ncbi:MAG: alpha/beta hydrolase [Planctomycetaceae bacterium]|nr:alpha/beta hydrolase [Planctomycetaceae bacterium]
MLILLLLLDVQVSASPWSGAERIDVRNPIDGVYEPSYFYAAKGENRPLLVALHSWPRHFDHAVNINPFNWAKQYDWNFLATNHRGPHDRKEAGGSRLALTDISEAIKEAKRRTTVGITAFAGCSGGGFTALNYLRIKSLEPVELIVSMNGPMNLKKWRKQNPSFEKDISALCSGAGCVRRSPALSLKRRRFPNTKIYLFQGLYDEVVHYSQGIEMFNTLASSGNHVFLQVGEHGHSCNWKAMRNVLVNELK